MGLLSGDGHPASVGERLDAPSPAEPAVAGGLDTTEGRVRLVGYGLVIDVHDAGADAVGDGQTVGSALGDDSAGQSVLEGFGVAQVGVAGDTGEHGRWVH